jgi:hypothetical protein
MRLVRTSECVDQQEGTSGERAVEVIHARPPAPVEAVGRFADQSSCDGRPVIYLSVDPVRIGREYYGRDPAVRAAVAQSQDDSAAL